MHPFKVGDGNPSGVGENIREVILAPVIEDVISSRSCGAIGSLSNNIRLDTVGIRFGNLVVQRCRYQNRALQLEQLLVGEAVCTRISLYSTGFILMCCQIPGVQTFGVVDSTSAVAGCNDRGSSIVQNLGSVIANITIALNRNRLFIHISI